MDVEGFGGGAAVQAVTQEGGPREQKVGIGVQRAEEAGGVGAGGTGPEELVLQGEVLQLVQTRWAC
ncbi:hypothetical protein ACWECC_05500 [Streptomyces microflavus]